MAGSAPPTLPTTMAPALTGPAPTRIHGLREIIRQFKTFSARRINELRGSPGKPVWQRNYFEHIIRPGNEIERIRNNVRKNPVQENSGAGHESAESKPKIR